MALAALNRWRMTMAPRQAALGQGIGRRMVFLTLILRSRRKSDLPGLRI
jgi:hypothetical protein